MFDPLRFSRLPGRERKGDGIEGEAALIYILDPVI